MSDEDLYQGREQTRAKHFILREYLKRFAHIIGFGWGSITYVDCFSGPWKNQSEELKDTSFAIALEELRKARQTHAARGKALALRAMFLEKGPAAYAKLKDFADKVTDIEVQTRNKDLANAVPDILRFIRAGSQPSFPFLFIDPTGWTGFEMAVIAPLLRLKPGEVLINFMTEHIRRFIDSPDEPTQDQFAALFGSTDVKARVQRITEPQEREDALFMDYAAYVKNTGHFDHVCAAVIPHGTKDRTYFHLIYATRDRAGVEAFKDVEKRAADDIERTRAGAKQRQRVKGSGQLELFAAEDLPHLSVLEQRRERYLCLARGQVEEFLRAQRRSPYEASWDRALSFPLVWESDLKDWIKDWRADGSLAVEGMKPRQRVPHLEEKNWLVWSGQ